VNAGVGGSLDDDAGAVETGGVLPRDRLSACDSNIGQYTMHPSMALPMHEREDTPSTRHWRRGSECTMRLCSKGALNDITYFRGRSKAIVAFVDTGRQVRLDTCPTWITSIASASPRVSGRRTNARSRLLT